MDKEPVILHVNSIFDVPENFTGVAVMPNGSKWWYLNYRLHREDGPAYEGKYGNRAWWLNGKRHRADGPAVEYANGEKDWYFDGVHFTYTAFYPFFEGNYIIIEQGIPTDVMFGELKLTQAKLLTAERTVFIYDNLPGLDFGEGNE
jgi:hypothetical protein